MFKKLFDFSDVLSERDFKQETRENVLSECCGAKVTESGFCTDCHDHCVGEDMTCEAIQDQEQKYKEPDQDYTNYRDNEINALNSNR